MEITDFTQKSFGIVGETTPPTTSDEGFDVSDTYIHKIEFSIRNISVAFANTLRRSFSTLCPTITFDHDNINIIENNQVHTQILSDIGVKDMILLSSPIIYHGINAFGLNVIKYVTK